MKGDDVLLAGHRPDGYDGLKVRFYPDDGHLSVAFLGRNGHEAASFELSGIGDLEAIGRVIDRAVRRHEELFSE
jgi:hypothetical protein